MSLHATTVQHHGPAAALKPAIDAAVASLSAVAIAAASYSLILLERPP